jgi:hypothetical protein
MRSVIAAATWQNLALTRSLGIARRVSRGTRRYLRRWYIEWYISGVSDTKGFPSLSIPSLYPFRLPRRSKSKAPPNYPWQWKLGRIEPVNSHSQRLP